MDLTLVDVTGIPDVALGDEVILLGKSESCSVERLGASPPRGYAPLRNSLRNLETRAAKIQRQLRP